MSVSRTAGPRPWTVLAGEAGLLTHALTELEEEPHWTRADGRLALWPGMPSLRGAGARTLRAADLAGWATLRGLTSVHQRVNERAGHDTELVGPHGGWTASVPADECAWQVLLTDPWTPGRELTGTLIDSRGQARAFTEAHPDIEVLRRRLCEDTPARLGVQAHTYVYPANGATSTPLTRLLRADHVQPPADRLWPLLTRDPAGTQAWLDTCESRIGRGRPGERAVPDSASLLAELFEHWAQLTGQAHPQASAVPTADRTVIAALGAVHAAAGPHTHAALCHACPTGGSRTTIDYPGTLAAWSAAHSTGLPAGAVEDFLMALTRSGASAMDASEALREACSALPRPE